MRRQNMYVLVCVAHRPLRLSSRMESGVRAALALAPATRVRET